MIKQVFQALNEDSRKGDFVNLKNKDRIDSEIDLTNDKIEGMSQYMWKKYIKNKSNDAALKYIKEENITKKKTRDIDFNEIKMSE